MTEPVSLGYDLPARIRVGPVQNMLREFVFIFFDRIYLIVAIAAAIFVITTAIALVLPPQYRATAKFSMTIPQAIDPLQRETYYDYQNRARRFLQDQKELIFSDRVLQKVADRIYANDPASPREKLKRLREHLEVTPPGGETFEVSSVFYLNFTDSQPRQAAAVAKAIAEAYLETYRELTKARAEYSYAFFTQQSQKLYDDMIAKEKALRDYESRQAVALIEILNLESGKGSNIEVGPNALLTQFEKKYRELQEELAGVTTAINAIEQEVKKDGIPVVLPEMEVTGRAITIFKRQVAQLQIQLNEMKPQFKEQYELFQRIQKELNLNIHSLRNELERTLKAQKITAQSIQARIKEVEGIIENLRSHIKTTAEQKSVYEHLKQEYAIAKDAYLNARNQLEQARLAQALDQEKQNLTLMDMPSIPLQPYKPNRILIIMLGFFSGLFVGIAMALLIDHFDHSIKKPDDIEQFLKLPLLGSVPKII
ncbi:MAG: hypothetical protein N3B18_04865 [Desulfobacterota bacterium]|nr:hypothetical protein [Thermodesulfobacteriota bacterium]